MFYNKHNESWMQKAASISFFCYLCIPIIWEILPCSVINVIFSYMLFIHQLIRAVFETVYYKWRHRLNWKYSKNVSHQAIFTHVVSNWCIFFLHFHSPVSAYQHIPFISGRAFLVQCYASFSKTVCKVIQSLYSQTWINDIWHMSSRRNREEWQQTEKLKKMEL